MANATDGQVATCRGCWGTAPKREGDRPPVGWYNLTVSVPDGYRRDGDPRPYLWVGLFCSAACLTAHGPVLAEKEALARQGYDAVIPEPAPLPAARNPASRKGHRP